MREGKRSAADMNHETTFAAYLNVVTVVADEIDQVHAALNVNKLE